ncbi:MAG: hypothetical protein ABIK12_17305 [Pseudomonadota bacterium]
MDRLGNHDSTAIFGEVDYATPKVRMPDSGGSNDITCSCGCNIIMMRMGKRNFVPKVDYVTIPSFLCEGDTAGGPVFRAAALS